MRGPRRGVVVGLVALTTSFAYWLPAFRDIASTGFGDWQYFHHMWEAGRVALARHGELLLWDPYQCGGVTMWGNPQAQVYSPLFFLSLLVGSTLAIKLHVVIHSAIGLAAAYELARREYELGLPAACIAAVTFALAGTFAWDGAGGHSTFLGFAYAPAILLAFRRAVVDPRWSAAVAALLALLLLEGGTYPFPYSLLLLGFDALVQAMDRAKRRGVIRALAIAGVLVAMLGAFRAVPAMLTLREHPRNLSPAGDALDFGLVVKMFTARDHAWRFGREFVWGEYDSFVGWTIVVLGLAGAILAWSRGRRQVVAGALVFGLFMIGNASSYHPWSIAQLLPVFDSMRVPSRFSVWFLLYFGLLAGIALDRLVHVLGRWRVRRFLEPGRVAIPFAVLAIAAVDIFDGNRDVVDRWNEPAVYDLEPEGRFHLVWPGNFHLEYASLPQRNRGTPACYEALNWPVARTLWIGDHPQARVAPPGTIRSDSRTPSSITVDVTLPEPGRVVLNQNYSRGWVANAGNVVADEGRLAVDLPAGDHRLRVAYRPGELGWTLVLLVLGIAATIATARFATADRLSRAGRFAARALGARRAEPEDAG